MSVIKIVEGCYFSDYHSGAVVLWLLDLQLPMQSVPITTDVSSNLDQVEVYTLCDKVCL